MLHLGVELNLSSKEKRDAQSVQRSLPITLHPACQNLQEVNTQLCLATAQVEEAENKQKLLEELKEHAEILYKSAKCETLEQTNHNWTDHVDSLQKRYWLVHTFIHNLYAQLMAQNHCHQLLRDLQAEQMWTREKSLLAENQDVGRSLITVNQLIRRHRLLVKEVASRNERIELILKEADMLLSQCPGDSDVLRAGSDASDSERKQASTESQTVELCTDEGIPFQIPSRILDELYHTSVDLRNDLNNLDCLLNKRSRLLDVGHLCFNHHWTYGELRSWLQETEDLIMLESRASRDTATAKAELRTHANVEFRVNGLLAQSVRNFTNFTSCNDHSNAIYPDPKDAQTADLLRQTKEESANLSDQLAQIKRKVLDLEHNRSLAVVEPSLSSRKREIRARIKQLDKRARVLQLIQATVDKQYAGLRDVCVEKRQRLEELLALNLVYDEVSDVESWLNQQVTVAALSETGRDLAECLKLLEQFARIASEVLGELLTGMLPHLGYDLTTFPELQVAIACLQEGCNCAAGGARRVERAVNFCRELIRKRHSDAPQVAVWEDRLTETWCDLTELMESRLQQLIAKAHCYIYLLRCSELEKLLQNKACQIPEVTSKEPEVITQQISYQTALEQDIQALEIRVQWVIRTASRLLPLYAGKWSQRLTRPRDKLTTLVESINLRMKNRKKRLQEALALHKWLTSVNELVRWINLIHSQLDEVMRVIHEQYTSGPSSSHQSLIELIKVQIILTTHCRSEMNAREDKVEECLRNGQLLHEVFLQESMGSQVAAERTGQLVAPKIVIHPEWGAETPNGEVEYAETDEHADWHSTNELEGDSELEARIHGKRSQGTSSGWTARPSSGTESHTTTTTTTTDADDLPSWDAETQRDNSQPPEEVYSSSTKSVNQLLHSPPSSNPSDEDTVTRDTLDLKGTEKHVPDLMICETSMLEEESRRQSEQPQHVCNQIKSNMIDLVLDWTELHKHCNQVFQDLHLHLSAVMFATEAYAAEQWLELHEPDLRSTELGDSIKATTALLLRHETLEHNLAMQADRFERLRRPTQLELVKLYGHPFGELLDLSGTSKPLFLDQSHAIWSTTAENLKSRLLSQYDLSGWKINGQSSHGEADVDRASDTVESSSVLPDVTDHKSQIPYIEFIDDHLNRKHEWQTETVRARDRCWYELYVVLQMSTRQLLVYRSKAHYQKDNPNAGTFRNEGGIYILPELVHVSLALDYTKRPHVFRLRMKSSGARYLFQASNQEIMEKWLGYFSQLADCPSQHWASMKITIPSPSEKPDNNLPIHCSTFETMVTEEVKKNEGDKQDSVKELHSSTYQPVSPSRGEYHSPGPRFNLKTFNPKSVFRWFKTKQQAESVTITRSVTTDLLHSVGHSAQFRMESEYERSEPIRRRSHFRSASRTMPTHLRCSLKQGSSFGKLSKRSSRKRNIINRPSRHDALWSNNQTMDSSTSDSSEVEDEI
ncbi:hypothetical protein PHET_03539 [Paragonimus heterotremus]|uniref:PH domain-containing protein n=1 Tax=Paragonimus heterotremus TaxID=100268 RepID=A0A8J4TIG2_9TREM|nr:hypothetical protein PHET_03539 [Paragonimus heterotremus]